MNYRNVPQGEAHYCAKLTETDVIKIKMLLEDGYTQTMLASLFNVSFCTIHDIKCGRTWRNI